MCVLICVNVSFALVIIRQGTGQTSWYHFLSPSLSPVLTSAFALKHPINTDVNRSGKNKPIILLAEWKSCTIIKSENEMKDRGLCILKLCVSSVHWRNRWVSEVVMTNHCTNTWQSHKRGVTASLGETWPCLSWVPGGNSSIQPIPD